MTTTKMKKTMEVMKTDVFNFKCSRVVELASSVIMSLLRTVAVQLVRIKSLLLRELIYQMISRSNQLRFAIC